MRHILIYLFSALVLLLFALLLVLFIPPAGRYIVEQAAQYYIGHALTLHHYHLTPSHLDLDGSFDDNSSVRLHASRFLTSRRTVRVHYDGKASLFNTLLKQNLSATPLQTDLRLYADDLRIHARLLGGLLDANASLDTERYDYTLSHIDIPQLLNALDPSQNSVSGGSLSAGGSGVGSDDHSSIFTLNNMKAPAVFPSAARIDGNITLSNASLLKGSLHLATTELSADVDTLRYDLQSALFSFTLNADNRDTAWLPVRHLEAMGSGEATTERLQGSLLIEADGLQCLLNPIHADLTLPRLHAKYRLSAQERQPLDLVGANALFGDLAYAQNTLDATVHTKTHSGPLMTLRYSADQLHAASNGLPIALVASMLHQTVPLSGSIAFKADADLNASYPNLLLTAESADMTLVKSIAEPSGMTAPFQLNMKVITLPTRRYKADLRITSGQLQQGVFKALFDPEALSGTLQGQIKRLKTTWYEGSDIALQSEADFKKQRIRHIDITSADEHIIIPRLDFGDDINATLLASVKRLDRFFPDTDPDSVLEANASFSSHADHSDISVTVGSIGTAHAVISDKHNAFSAEGIALGNLFVLAGQTPAPLTGRVSVTGVLDPRSATMRLTSEALTPSSERNGSLRPFPLDLNTTLLHCGSRYFGETELSAGADRLILSSLDIDIAERRLTSHYRLAITDGNRSILKLPETTLVLPLEANGKLTFANGRSDLSLHTSRFALGHHLHRFLEHNASGPLPLTLDMNLSHTSGQLYASGTADAAPAFTLPFDAEYNVTGHTIRVDASQHSLKNDDNATVALHLQGVLEGSVIDNADLLARTERFNLRIHALHLDTEHNDYRGNFQLGLLPQNSRFKREAIFTGTVHTRPELNVTLRTKDMEGNLSAVMNDDLLILHAKALSLPHILGYVQTASPIESGTLSGNIILNTPPLLNGNLSRLNGGVDLHLYNVVLIGFNIDDRLQTLQDSQDFSLFQGSLFEMPLIRSLASLPNSIFARQAVQSEFVQSRYALAISEGKAVCVDCASATPKHRVAAAGDIDLVTERFGAFYLALLNPKGCPYYMQRIRGPLNDPNVNIAASGVKVIGGAVLSVASNVTQAADFLTEHLYHFTSATGEVISYVPIAGTAVDTAVNALTGGLHDATNYVSECTPFYLGTIPAPKTK